MLDVFGPKLSAMKRERERLQMDLDQTTAAPQDVEAVADTAIQGEYGIWVMSCLRPNLFG